MRAAAQVDRPLRMEKPPDMDAKKLIGLVVVVFLGFWMFTDPSGLADTAKSAGAGGWDLTTQLFSQLIDFIGELG
jgi:hypothetical protein